MPVFDLTVFKGPTLLHVTPGATTWKNAIRWLWGMRGDRKMTRDAARNLLLGMPWSEVQKLSSAMTARLGE